MLRAALGALLLLAACGPAPTAPMSPVSTTPVPPTTAPVPPTAAPTLNLSVSATPFHVGMSGEIRYEVTNVPSLASVAYSSTDGQGEVRASMGPAPAVGVVRVTYGHPGSFTVTVKATTMLGTTLQASVLVDVVE